MLTSKNTIKFIIGNNIPNDKSLPMNIYDIHPKINNIDTTLLLLYALPNINNEFIILFYLHYYSNFSILKLYVFPLSILQLDTPVVAY